MRLVVGALVALLLAFSGEARAQTALVLRGADPSVARELSSTAAAALGARTRLIDVSATPAAARMTELDVVGLERLRVELDFDLVVVIEVSPPERGRLTLRFTSTSGGAPHVREERRTPRRLASAVRVALEDAWTAHESAVRASIAERQGSGTGAIAAAVPTPEVHTPPAVAAAEPPASEPVRPAPEPAAPSSSIPPSVAAPAPSSPIAATPTAPVAPLESSPSRRRPRHTDGSGADRPREPVVQTPPPSHEAAPATEPPPAPAEPATALPVPSQAPAPPEPLATPAVAQPTAASEPPASEEPSTGASAPTPVPPPAPIVFPLSDGFLFGAGLTLRSVFPVGVVDLAHYGSVGRVGVRLEFSELFLSLGGTLAGRVLAIPLQRHIGIVLFAGGYLEVTTGSAIGIGVDTFALVRLTDIFYAEARGSLGWLEVTAQPGGATDPTMRRGSLSTFVGSITITAGITFGAPSTPDVQNASALPRGERLDAEGGSQ